MIEALKRLAGKGASPTVVDCIRDEFGLMQVVDTATTRSLYFNTLVEQSRQFLHAPMTLGFEYQQLLFDHIMAYAQDRRAPSICMLGVGGGTLATHCHLALPDSPQTLVDIRESVFEVAHDYFGLPRTPHIQTQVADAQAFVLETASGIQQTEQSAFDIWVLDLYDQHTMPEAFSDVVFLAALAQCIGAPGLVLFNLWRGNAHATTRVIEFWEQHPDFDVTTHPTQHTGNIILAAQPRQGGR
jgi:spermidine synthase